MKKWMKSKLLTIITVIVVAGVGIGSLRNASKLESLFNPGKFKKFENRYHSDKYDYAAGDGENMNLADEDKEGKVRMILELWTVKTGILPPIEKVE